MRDSHALVPLVDKSAPDFSVKRELLHGIDILGRNKQIAIATVVRVINNAPYFGFFVFLPFFFTENVGMSGSQYLWLITVMGIVGIIMDLFIGKISNAFGWRRTVGWLGCVGGAIVTLAIYWVPQWVPNHLLAFAVASLVGIVLPGFIPLSAMMTTMVDDKDKGNAMASYSLAAGLCTFIGPATYAVLGPWLGYGGVMAVYAGMYLVGAFLTLRYLRIDQDPGDSDRHVSAPAGRRSESATV